MKFFLSFLIVLLTSLHAKTQLNIYNAISRAGYTPGLALAMSGDSFGIELGGNYALGSSTVNVSYDSYAANLFLTYTSHIDKDQRLVFKGGGGYREATSTYINNGVIVVDREILFYNWGLDYIFEVKDLGNIGFSYFADSFGIVYGVTF